MRNLKNFASREDVQSFVSGLLRESKSELFQGVLVGYHPLWQRLTGPPFYGRDIPSQYWLPTATWPEWDQSLYDGIEVRDPDWKSAPWEKFCEENGIKEPFHPFVIIFRLKPLTPDDLPDYQRIVGLSRSGRFFTAVEQRPIAKLFGRTGSAAIKNTVVEGGTLIRPIGGQEGALGGFLKDARNNNVYGLTCSHVASVGDDIEAFDTKSSSWNKIGTCVQASTIKEHTNCGAQCYRNADSAKVDVALIELDGFSASNKIVGLGQAIELIDSINVPADVQIGGGKSGKLGAKAHKYGMWHELEMPSGACACFEDIFELSAPPAGWANSVLVPKYAQLFSTTVQNGDSGSWVVSKNKAGANKLDVCGTVIGGDGLTGFATFMQNTKSWSTSHVGIVLEPL